MNRQSYYYKRTSFFEKEPLPKKLKVHGSSCSNCAVQNRSSLEACLASWFAKPLFSFCPSLTWHWLLQVNHAVYHTTAPFFWSMRSWYWSSEEAFLFPEYALPYVRSVTLKNHFDEIPLSVREIKWFVPTDVTLQKEAWCRLAFLPKLDTLLLFEVETRQIYSHIDFSTMGTFPKTLTKLHVHGHATVSCEMSMLFPCLHSLFLRSLYFVKSENQSENGRLPSTLIKLRITTLHLHFERLFFGCFSLTSLHLSLVHVPLSGDWFPRSLRILRIHRLLTAFNNTDALPELIVFSLCSCRSHAGEWQLPNSIRYLRLPSLPCSLSFSMSFKELRVLKCHMNHLAPLVLHKSTWLEEVIVIGCEVVNFLLGPDDLPSSIRRIRFKCPLFVVQHSFERLWATQSKVSFLCEKDGPLWIPHVNPEPKNKYKQVYGQWLLENSR